jgi:hypothetical protein
MEDLRKIDLETLIRKLHQSANPLIFCYPLLAISAWQNLSMNIIHTADFTHVKNVRIGHILPPIYRLLALLVFSLIPLLTS